MDIPRNNTKIQDNDYMLPPICIFSFAPKVPFSYYIKYHGSLKISFKTFTTMTLFAVT